MCTSSPGILEVIQVSVKNNTLKIIKDMNTCFFCLKGRGEVGSVSYMLTLCPCPFVLCMRVKKNFSSN